MNFSTELFYNMSNSHKSYTCNMYAKMKFFTCMYKVDLIVILPENIISWWQVQKGGGRPLCGRGGELRQISTNHSHLSRPHPFRSPPQCVQSSILHRGEDLIHTVTSSGEYKIDNKTRLVSLKKKYTVPIVLSRSNCILYVAPKFTITVLKISWYM